MDENYSINELRGALAGLAGIIERVCVLNGETWEADLARSIRSGLMDAIQRDLEVEDRQPMLL